METNINAHEARTLNITTKSNVAYRCILFLKLISTQNKEEYMAILKELNGSRGLLKAF